jgi:hypothetical protein
VPEFVVSIQQLLEPFEVEEPPVADGLSLFSNPLAAVPNHLALDFKLGGSGSEAEAVTVYECHAKTIQLQKENSRCISLRMSAVFACDAGQVPDCDYVPPSAPSPLTPSNPIMYYDEGLNIPHATPTTLGIFPANPALAAVCYALHGSAPMFGWNPTTGQWI